MGPTRSAVTLMTVTQPSAPTVSMITAPRRPSPEPAAKLKRPSTMVDSANDTLSGT